MTKEYLKFGLKYFNALLFDSCGNVYFYETYKRTARTMNKIWSLHFYRDNGQEVGKITCSYNIVNLSSSESRLFDDKDEYDFSHIWNTLNSGGWTYDGGSKTQKDVIPIDDNVYLDYLYAQTLVEEGHKTKILWSPNALDHWDSYIEVLYDEGPSEEVKK